MCLDLEWRDTAPEEVKDEDGIETGMMDGLEGKVMDGFEDAFFDEGGRVGGW